MNAEYVVFGSKRNRTPNKGKQGKTIIRLRAGNYSNNNKKTAAAAAAETAATKQTEKRRIMLHSTKLICAVFLLCK